MKVWRNKFLSLLDSEGTVDKGLRLPSVRRMPEPSSSPQDLREALQVAMRFARSEALKGTLFSLPTGPANSFSQAGTPNLATNFKKTIEGVRSVGDIMW